MGVKVAVDDFGGGYAYRADLQQMPIDFLKVDRASLAASEDEDYRSWLLEAILVFGRDLALTVIAKGVESQEQAEALRAMGCTMAQGYFLGEPAPGEEVDRLIGAAPVPGATAAPVGPMTVVAAQAPAGPATPDSPATPLAAAPAPPAAASQPPSAATGHAPAGSAPSGPAPVNPPVVSGEGPVAFRAPSDGPEPADPHDGPPSAA